MDGERSGYDLVKLAERGVGYIWAPAKSRIYAVLTRLLAARLVVRRGVRQADRPDKQLYRVTRAGERAFRAWLEQPDWRGHDELLLKVFFGAHTDPERLAVLLERYRDAERARLADYADVEKRIADQREARFGYATLRYGIATARARVRWTEELLRELGAAT